MAIRRRDTFLMIGGGLPVSGLSGALNVDEIINSPGALI
jgi:hypothetical protein